MNPVAGPSRSVGPVDAAGRVQALDVLRGVALFGVFLANLTNFIQPDVMSTEEQLLALPTAGIDAALYAVLRWLVDDKANTLFAFLFGLGFYLQMERLQARGADFERIYLRRLAVLLVGGTLHALLIWNWDILHLYALAGFALFAMRNVGNRTLLVGGVFLALIGRMTEETFNDPLGFEKALGLGTPFTEQAVIVRQHLSQAGDYLGLVRNFGIDTWFDYVVSGGLLAWFLYALGRFMLGAWVGRRRWLQTADQHLDGFRRVLRIALPVGLILEGASVLIEVHLDAERLPDWDIWPTLDSVLHFVATPVLAAGYLCAVVVALHGRTGQRLLAPFAAVGRMALTNYVTQSFVIGFVLFGIGPGLALAGRIGTTAMACVAVVFFAVQVMVSGWWLRRFRYGPLEWVWRRLTYGRL